MLVDRKATKLGKRFSLKKAFIIQEKKMGRNISAKPHHINKRENWNILCLQAFKLAKRGSPEFVNLLFAGSQSPEKKIVAIFTTCSSSSNQIQNSRVGRKKKIKQLESLR